MTGGNIAAGAGVGFFQCGHCTFRTMSQQGMEYHVRSVHASIESMLPTVPARDVLFSVERLHRVPNHVVFLCLFY